ncbi:MAG: hypothetical protein WC712_02850 [Candidatus Brocadiia bacterium]
MKSLALVPLFLLAICFLMADNSTAEDEVIEPLVTRTFDLSEFLSPALSFTAPRIDDPGRAVEVPDTIPNIDTLLDRIVQFADWKAGKGEGSMYLTFDFRLVVRAYPSKIRDIERAVEMLFPHNYIHDLTVALAVKNEAQTPPTLDPQMSLDAALAVLKEKGFALEWITRTTALPGHTAQLLGGSTQPYVADQEGLIATFARAYDPVIKNLSLGTHVFIKCGNDDDKTTIDLVVLEARLKEMKVARQNGNDVQTPLTAYNHWRRILEFRGAGIRSVGYVFDGTSRVLLLQLER